MTIAQTIQCEEALRLLAVYLDGELHGADHTNVENHLKTCRSCFSRGEFERRLKAELGELSHDVVRPGFEQHIRQLITQFTASSPKRSDE
ncbi:MAG TPA: zf-HC2 domain-containing protein [Gemmatimonadaceae bacterium]|nr:zf-HC2 domain-containing protein [Gemmatimonadaceae bacterium]